MKKLLVLFAAALLAAACSGPSGSSDSVVTPHSYGSDVENSVILAMRRDFGEEDLLRQLGVVARRHGVEDWQSSDEAFTAIGNGLRRAKVAEDRATAVAELVSAGNPEKRRLVLRAFEG
jgi:ABC-type glycerol-3-phosphate transport system substrate-binding protein